MNTERRKDIEFHILLVGCGWTSKIVEAPIRKGQKTVLINGTRFKIIQDQGRLADRIVLDDGCAGRRRVGSCTACCRWLDCKAKSGV